MVSVGVVVVAVAVAIVVIVAAEDSSVPVKDRKKKLFKLAIDKKNVIKHTFSKI